MRLASAWHPILEGALAERAEAAIIKIAASLCDKSGLEEPSLAMGNAGLALFHGYLALRAPNEAEKATALHRLDRAIEVIASARRAPALFQGVAGVAWAAEHLRQRFFESGGEDPNEAVDELLTEMLEGAWHGPLDLMSGITGLGVYALERWPCPAAAVILQRVVDRLNERAERFPEGIAWWISPEAMGYELAHQDFPDGYYDPGLAHGVSGTIAVLAQAARVGITGALDLLEGAVSWLLTCAREQGDAFPFIMSKTRTLVMKARRTSWCRSEPGVSYGLFLAARCVGQRAWEEQALELARRCATRPLDESVNDAPFCHGAVGIAHMFNRVYQSSGDSAFRDAALSWFGRVLDMGSEGLDGWRALKGGVDGPYWSEEVGVLYGLAGIGLALLAATTSIEPSWDRVFALSARPLPAV